ncbi:MAG: hypothetical protein ACKVVT_14315 [Dehalococcoidia bacterium]
MPLAPPAAMVDRQPPTMGEPQNDDALAPSAAAIARAEAPPVAPSLVYRMLDLGEAFQRTPAGGAPSAGATSFAGISAGAAAVAARPSGSAASGGSATAVAGTMRPGAGAFPSLAATSALGSTATAPPMVSPPASPRAGRLIGRIPSDAARASVASLTPSASASPLLVRRAPPGTTAYSEPDLGQDGGGAPAYPPLPRIPPLPFRWDTPELPAQLPIPNMGGALPGRGGAPSTLFGTHSQLAGLAAFRQDADELASYGPLPLPPVAQLGGAQGGAGAAEALPNAPGAFGTIQAAEGPAAPAEAGGQPGGAAGAGSGAGATGEVDKLADQIWQVIRRKLAIERERQRGR